MVLKVFVSLHFAVLYSLLPKPLLPGLKVKRSGTWPTWAFSLDVYVQMEESSSVAADLNTGLSVCESLA